MDVPAVVETPSASINGSSEPQQDADGVTANLGGGDDLGGADDPLAPLAAPPPWTMPTASGGGGWLPEIVLIEPREIEALKRFKARLISLELGHSFWRPGRAAQLRYAKAAVALLGQWLIWVGSWDLLSCEARNRDDYSCDWALAPQDGTRVNVGYTAGGLLILCLTDTYCEGAATPASAFVHHRG